MSELGKNFGRYWAPSSGNSVLSTDVAARESVESSLHNTGRGGRMFLRRLPFQASRARLSVALLALISAVGFAAGAFATPIQDVKGSTHSYGGYTCDWGGGSELASAGGSSGLSGTLIVTAECQNGYRELYTEARTTTNGFLQQYTGWVTYDVGWPYGYRTDLCQVWGSHRMSKAGVDTSGYLNTYVQGCLPG